MDGKAAVLGSADFVMPFAALGIDAFAVEAESQKVVGAAQEILKRRYTLVIVAENVAAAAQTVFETAQKRVTPCVVVVPFTTEPSGLATESLGRLLKMATGINILQ